MADGKHCPACGHDIGVRPIFTAGLPNWIRCPHCSARLRYRGIAGVALVLVAVLAAVVVGALYGASAIPGLHPSYQPAAAAGILFGAWAVVELAVARFLRGNRTLVRRDDPGAASDGPDAEPGAAPDRGGM